MILGDKFEENRSFLSHIDIEPWVSRFWKICHYKNFSIMKKCQKYVQNPTVFGVLKTDLKRTWNRTWKRTWNGPENGTEIGLGVKKFFSSKILFYSDFREINCMWSCWKTFSSDFNDITLKMKPSTLMYKNWKNQIF